MIGTFTSLWNRVFAVLGRVSMYRLALLALAALALVAFAVSFFRLVAPTPLELVVTLLVLAVVCVGVDAAAQSVMKLPWRIESSLITAHILLFVLRPTLDLAGLAGIALAAAVASLSKYVLAWRGRHIFNPAAAGAAVLTIVSIWLPDLGASSWWVGTPVLAAPVILLGLAVLVRTEKVRVITVFVVIAVAVGVARTATQYEQAGLAIDTIDVLWTVLWSSPFLFLGAFMLSEPLTMPPRRWQQFTVAALVGVLAGWPIDLGVISLGQERALLIGNLLAFAFAFSMRSAVKLTLESRAELTPTVQALTFRARRRLAFLPGQYLELDVPHRHPDARGTRREFSIASAPEDLPLRDRRLPRGFGGEDAELVQEGPRERDRRRCAGRHRCVGGFPPAEEADQRRPDGRRRHRHHSVRVAAAPRPARRARPRHRPGLRRIRGVGARIPRRARGIRHPGDRVHPR